MSSEVRQLRVIVRADDFETAVAFYRDALGLREEAAFDHPSGARVVILDAGRATLEIANPEQVHLIDELEVGRQVSPHIRIAFEVDDVLRYSDALTESGASVIAPATETPWRTRNARLEAPAGLQLTLFQPLDEQRPRQR